MTKTEKDNDEQLVELQKRCEEYLNGWKRAQADYQNLEKETVKRMSESAQLATAVLLEKFLPLFDNIERGLSHVEEEDKQKEWVRGLAQIQKQFAKILEEFNIKKIESVGQKFDPHYHEAIGSAEGDGEGIVLEEAQAGYLWHDKVLRPAKVVVSK